MIPPCCAPPQRAGDDPPMIRVEDIAASAHLFNASYAGIQGVTLGAYAYIMNFEDVGAWDNKKFTRRCFQLRICRPT